MNWKNRLTNYNFWISIFSAMLLILQALKIEFDIAYVNEIFTAVLGLLVVIGIISDPTRTTVKAEDNKQQTKTEIKEEIKEEQTQKESENIPNDEKNETNFVDIQTDFQTILNKISTDIDEKMLSLTEKLQQFETKTIVEEKLVEQVEDKETSPAVAEMENPYIDTIN